MLMILNSNNLKEVMLIQMNKLCLEIMKMIWMLSGLISLRKLINRMKIRINKILMINMLLWPKLSITKKNKRPINRKTKKHLKGLLQNQL